VASHTQEKHPQVEQRRRRVFKDRHGRSYDAVIDIRTNDPVSRLRPLFRAPWMHPDNFIKLRHNLESGESWVELQDDQLIQSLEVAHKEWEERMMQLGYAMHGESFNPDRPTAQLLRLVGRRPQRMEYALAAKQNDAWVLGLSPTLPKWAAKIQKESAGAVDKFAFLKDDEDDPYGSLEEEVDPQAVGGKKVRPKPAPRAA
jgi:hypothetical protein